MYKRTLPHFLALLICVQLLAGLIAPHTLYAADAQRSGTVTDGAGQLLPGVELVVLKEVVNDQGRHEWQEVTRTTTDGNGHYAITNLPPGNYVIELGEAARHSGQEYIIFEDQTPRHGQAMVQAAAQGAINGTVTDQQGKKVGQVAVSLYAVVDANGYTYEQLVRRMLTDDKGRYKFRDLPAGQYKMGFADTLYPERYVAEYYPDAMDLWTATVIDLTGDKRQIDAQLGIAGSLAGRVTNGQGEALVGVGVELYRYSDDGSGYMYWQTVNWTNTFGDGSYTFSGLATGSYRLYYADNQWPALYAPEYYNNAAVLELATDVLVSDGAAVTGIDVQLAPPGQILGTVTDEAGQPIEGIGVNLYSDPDGDGYWAQNYSGGTDASGAYSVSGLPAGVYRVAFVDWMGPWRYQPEYYNDAATLESATDIVVAEGAIVEEIDAHLAPTGHIQGQVTDMDGQPLANAAVLVYTMWEGGEWYPMNAVATDALGFYDLGGLVTGTYRVGFAYSLEVGHVVAEYYDNVATVEEATDIVVVAGAIVSGINAELPKPGAVQGAVTDENGQPLANIVVNALRQVSLPTGETDWYHAGSTTTNAGGTYLLTNLAAGQYRLEFGDYMNWPHQYSSEYYDNVATVAEATSLAVASGATISGIDARLAGVGTISGQVFDSTGAPVADIAVAALRLVSDGQGNRYWSEVSGAVTDAIGDYTLPGVDVGVYRVVFRDYQSPRRYATLYYANVSDIQFAQDVVVAANAQVTGINAQLSIGSQLSGAVTNMAGEPVVDANVTLFRAQDDGMGNIYWDYYSNSMTQSDGSYTLTALSAGIYRLGVFDWSGQYQSLFYENAVDLESATDILVDGQQAVTGINVQLPAFSATNVAPLARNDRFAVVGAAGQQGRQGSMLNILRNDDDPNGDALTVQLVTGPQHGTLTLSTDGSFTYTPNANYIGADRFTYQATDGVEPSNIATVELVVEASPAVELYHLWMPIVIQ